MNANKMKEILDLAVQKNASDVHFTVDKPPMFRIYGDIRPSGLPPLNSEDLQNLLFSIMLETQIALFKENSELDFSYNCSADHQMRVNICLEKGNIAGTVRITPMQIKSLTELHLPPIVKELSRKHQGIIILAGPAGSGKSTTMNFIVDLINKERHGKILTIEDPIEYIHQSQNCLVTQREVGADTKSFATALKYGLRQDPDVVVVGEMRDLESISMGITTAETGHLVITTVHAPDAIETINRIIDVYPPAARDQLCMQLAENLLAVIAHVLVRRCDTEGRILATEILVTNVAVRNLIRHQSFPELRGFLNLEEHTDMHSFERCLSDYANKGWVSPQVAEDYAKHKHSLKFSDKIMERHLKEKANQKKEQASAEEHYLTKNILIVDQNPEDLNTMVNILRQAGYANIYKAQSVSEVVKIIKLIPPDIVILDKMFRDIKVTSLALCQEFKSSKYPHELMPKVIFITGRLEVTDQDEIKNAGGDDFIVKTQAYELLVKAIKKVCLS